MVPYTPEELQEEILEKYGALVPLDEIYSYNEDDPFLNADDIYDLYTSHDTPANPTPQPDISSDWRHNPETIGYIILVILFIVFFIIGICYTD